MKQSSDETKYHRRKINGPDIQTQVKDMLSTAIIDVSKFRNGRENIVYVTKTVKKEILVIEADKRKTG